MKIKLREARDTREVAEFLARICRDTVEKGTGNPWVERHVGALMAFELALRVASKPARNPSDN